MAKKNATDTLKEAIQLLEKARDAEGELLKEQFHLTYESLKPINLIRNTFREVVDSHEIQEKLVEAGVDAVTGFVAKKINEKTDNNKLLKIGGLLLQIGVTNYIARNPVLIQSKGVGLLSSLLERFDDRKPRIKKKNKKNKIKIKEEV